MGASLALPATPVLVLILRLVTDLAGLVDKPADVRGWFLASAASGESGGGGPVQRGALAGPGANLGLAVLMQARESPGLGRSRIECTLLPEVGHASRLPFRIQNGFADVVFDVTVFVENDCVAAVEGHGSVIRHALWLLDTERVQLVREQFQRLVVLDDRLPEDETVAAHAHAGADRQHASVCLVVQPKGFPVFPQEA